MDLFTVQAIEQTIEITHPNTGENIGLRVTVRPESHPEVKKAQRKNLDANLTAKKSKVSAKTVEANTMNLLIACVGGWEWYGEELNFKGDSNPELTPEKIEEVFTALPWLKDQVRAKFDDGESFFEA